MCILMMRTYGWTDHPNSSIYEGYSSRVCYVELVAYRNADIHMILTIYDGLT